MFISASRRTDIPSHYSEWFMNRIRAGFVLVRNPVNPRQASRVSLSQDVVDGIVFWTKNPIPMLDKLDGLRGYMYCFQFTLNAYGSEVERGIPTKNAQLVDAFRRLSDKIGPERVLWRYDPIFVSGTHTVYFIIRLGIVSSQTIFYMCQVAPSHRVWKKFSAYSNLGTVTESIFLIHISN